MPRYSRRVPIEEIATEANAYNLNLTRYVDSTEPEDIQDLDAHLNGGIHERDIAALKNYWAVLPNLRETLFESAGRPGYVQLTTPIAEVKTAILDHTDFEAFNESATAHFAMWRDAHTPRLKEITIGDTAAAQEYIMKIREGEPLAASLKDSYRKRLEDVLWAMLNSPEFLFVP